MVFGKNNRKRGLTALILVLAMSLAIIAGMAVTALADAVPADGDDIIGGADEPTSVLLIASDETAVDTFEGNAGGQWLDSTFYKLDRGVFSFFGKLQNKVLTPVMNVYTELACSKFAVLMILVGLGLAVSIKYRRLGLTIAFCAIIGAFFTNLILKNVVGRARPYITLSGDSEFMGFYNAAGANTESDNSFPSGHTTFAFDVGIGLFLYFRNKKWRWVFPAYAVLILCSRLYLMVHYFTDVIAGTVVGCVAGVLGYALVTYLMKKPAVAAFNARTWLADTKAKLKGSKNTQSV